MFGFRQLLGGGIVPLIIYLLFDFSPTLHILPLVRLQNPIQNVF